MHWFIWTPLSDLPSRSSYDPAYPPNAPRNDNLEDPRIDPRYLTRTPSPTPSEAEELSGTKKKSKGFLMGLFDPEKLKNPKELSASLHCKSILHRTADLRRSCSLHNHHHRRHCPRHPLHCLPAKDRELAKAVRGLDAKDARRLGHTYRYPDRSVVPSGES